jgi:hypothetical protein
MFEIDGKPETAASRSTDCRKRAISVRLSEHGYNRFINFSRMPGKALIRANDEFWRIRQWFSIQKEKNACMGRFFAFNAVVMFFFA